MVPLGTTTIITANCVDAGIRAIIESLILTFVNVYRSSKELISTLIPIDKLKS
jgi:hypothetical protein